MIWTQPLPNFTRDELADPDTGEIRLHLSFAIHLPFLRLCWGEALVLNSACRSAEHNDEVDGHPRSLHLMTNPVHPTDGCMAADIAWHEWTDERKRVFARMAWVLGWSIGLHDGFAHIDRRVDIGLTQEVFTYDEWAAPFTEEEIRQ